MTEQTDCLTEGLVVSPAQSLQPACLQLLNTVSTATYLKIDETRITRRTGKITVIFTLKQFLFYAILIMLDKSPTLSTLTTQLMQIAISTKILLQLLQHPHPAKYDVTTRTSTPRNKHK